MALYKSFSYLLTYLFHNSKLIWNSSTELHYFHHEGDINISPSL